MLKITVTLEEGYDEETSTFTSLKSEELTLEHSLVSVSNWESKWKIAFLGKEPKTTEQTIDYIRFMTIGDASPEVYDYLSQKNVDDISDYINSSQSATHIRESDLEPKSGSQEIITSEIIYYWMVANNIPFECQYWPLGRLITLIRICGIKNQPERKRSKREILEENRALNAKRREQYGTSG